SAILYVNLAGYHVKAVRGSLASRASGMLVTGLYAAAAFAGLLMGWIEANHGWPMAGMIQMSVLSIVGAVLALALRPREMAPSRATLRGEDSRVPPPCDFQACGFSLCVILFGALPSG